MNKQPNIKKKKQTWPTKDVMEKVCEKKICGGGEVVFYSGDGSHDSVLVKPYIDVLSLFLKSFKTTLLCVI
tara:strand:- start:19530 stop:19742 length:213 start_codon:yes stop_codon:yes gene_type:complete